MNNNPTRRDLISQMYKEHAKDLKRYLQSYTHDVMKAEDMLHDIFIKVMQLDIIIPSTSRSLLTTMARHAIIDDERRQTFARRLRENVAYGAERTELPSSAMAEANNIRQLEHDKLQTMAVKRANVYRLYRYEGMTAKQIALQLNISQRTVEMHIYLSTREMRSFMKRVM